MTAREKFTKNGVIKQISDEYFNRYKGTEWYFSPRTIDGQRMVLGYVGSYPDTGQWSEFSGEYISMPFEDFCSAWDSAPDRSIWGILKNLREQGATSVSAEKYRVMLAQGVGVPQCKHCNQTIL